MLRLELQVGIVWLEGEEVLEGSNRCREMLIEGGKFLLHLFVDKVLPLSLFDPEVRPEDIEKGQVGHGAPIVEAPAFEIGVLGERMSHLEDDSRFAHPRFANDPHHLSLA